MDGSRGFRDGEVRTAEVVAMLCLATDLGMGFPREHGLHATLTAMRLADRLAVDEETAFETYYGSLLYYAGCTADAEIAAELFPEGGLLEHFTPAVFGSTKEVVGGVAKAIGHGVHPAPARLLRIARRMPVAARGRVRHITAMCEVAQMLSARLGMPPRVSGLFSSMAERWDGRGEPAHLSGEELPLALRIVQVARDATFQRLVRGEDEAAAVIRGRAGGAFDPGIAEPLADDFAELTAPAATAVWDAVLDAEPGPGLSLVGEDLDGALAAIANFSDLVSPCFVGHSSGVADLAAAAADILGLSGDEQATVRRAGLVHDVGRVAVPARVWLEEGPLSADDWEHVRLHAYQTERVALRSSYLSSLAAVAGLHHERLDGSGYHRGSTATTLTPLGRLLAAADAFHTKTEPRAHREALPVAEAAAFVEDEARAGRLDGACVAAVVQAAGLRRRPSVRPQGLTQREVEVVGLLARGLQTKQVARTLGISAKTADRHLQNSYAKIGVSSRAALAVFAMQHGLVWGELPMEAVPPHP